MRLVEHDTPPKGPSKGDTVVYRDRLVNAVRQFGRKQGAVVGRDRGTMTYTSRSSARFDGVATLPGGDAQAAGPVQRARERRPRDPDRRRLGPLQARRGDAHGGAGE